jgi:hypothetical protein
MLEEFLSSVAFNFEPKAFKLALLISKKFMSDRKKSCPKYVRTASN